MISITEAGFKSECVEYFFSNSNAHLLNFWAWAEFSDLLGSLGPSFFRSPGLYRCKLSIAEIINSHRD